MCLSFYFEGVGVGGRGSDKVKGFYFGINKHVQNMKTMVNIYVMVQCIILVHNLYITVVSFSFLKAC